MSKQGKCYPDAANNSAGNSSCTQTDTHDNGFQSRLRMARRHFEQSQQGMGQLLGISKNSWQLYESGGQVPGSSVMASLARLGINTNWVLIGEGPMLINDLRAAQESGGAVDINLDLLERVAAATFKELQARDLQLEPAAQARLVRVLYRHFASRGEQPDQETVSNIIDLAAYR